MSTSSNHSRTHSPRALPGLLLILLLTLLFPALVSAQGTPAPSPAAGPGDTDPALYEAVLADHRDDITAETAGRLSRYRIDGTLTPATVDQPATISGSLDLRYVNTTGAELPALYFRLYPNGEEYAEGAMTLAEVTVDGATVAPVLGVQDTVAMIALPTRLASDEAVDVRLNFQTVIPTDPAASYGMFAYDVATGSYALAHWLPLLAGYDPVDGWQLDQLSANGDPVFSNTALFDVAITLPGDFVLVTTGNQVEERAEGDQVRRRFVTGPARDFVMAADTDFQSASETVDGTVVTSWFNPDNAEGGRAVLDQGAEALGIFNELFGQYPYQEMDLIEIDLGNGAGGVEFPQLMFIGGDFYGDSLVTRAIPEFLEVIVAHEVAHQWWYAMIGNNQHTDAYLDEGLTNMVTMIYFRERYGPESFGEQIDINLKLPYLTMLFSQGDQIVDQPTDDFPSMNAYATAVYAKGALGFEAIRQEIGDDAFFAALRDYAERKRFTIATPDDLRAAFERASGQNLSELWRHWFEAAEGQQDFSRRDYAELLVKIGQ